jgi:hypothetical protein
MMHLFWKLHMNIFDAVSIRIPCPVCNEHYEVPLSDLLLSNWMLNEGCPVCEETKCPPLCRQTLLPESRRSTLRTLDAWSSATATQSRRISRNATGSGTGIVEQTRLIGSEILSELAIAWNRLENNVRRNNGELVSGEHHREGRAGSHAQLETRKREINAHNSNASIAWRHMIPILIRKQDSVDWTKR